MLPFFENAPADQQPWIPRLTRRDRTMRVIRAVVLTVFTMGLVGSITVIPVEAHAFLEESTPAPNAIVATAPTDITMRFSEPLERSYSKAELYNQDGNLIPEATIAEGSDDYTMVLNLPSDLSRGTYTVLWRTLSTADGHTAQNYLAFTVGTAADVDPNLATAATTTSSGPPSWLTTLARWTALVGLASALAVWPIWMFVLRPAIAAAWRIGPELTRAMRGFAVGAVIFAFMGNLFAILVQASSLTDGSYLDALHETLGDTRYGRLWLIRIALLFLYGLALQWTAWWRPRRTPALSALALVSAIALPFPFSLIAHASAQTTGRSSAIFNDFIHLVAASIWIGGLIALVAVLLPTLRGIDPVLRRQVLSRALPRFSTIALTAWVSLALTGFYSAWLHVGNVDALLHTDYGKTLIIKLIILVPILFLAAFNLLFVTSHLDRRSRRGGAGPWVQRLSFTVGAEAALAIAVLVVVGSLTSQAPARETIASEPQQVAITFDGDDRQATLKLTPGVAGPNRYTLDIGGDAVPPDAEVLLRVELPDQDTGENEIELSRTEANVYVYEGSELSIGGEWTFTLLIRPPGEAEWRSSVTHDISSVGSESQGPGPAWHFGTVSGIVGMVSILSGVAAIFAIRTSPNSSRRRSVRLTALIVIFVGAVILYIGRVEPDAIEQGEAQAISQSSRAEPTWLVEATTAEAAWR